MLRPRAPTPLDTPNAERWRDPNPPASDVRGGSNIGNGRNVGGGPARRRRASPTREGTRGRWFSPGRIVGSKTSKSASTEATTVVGAAKTMLYQLVLWPLTLCVMLVSSIFRFTLRVGCHGSPLRFRDPPRWLVRLISKPCRLINPPVSFGGDNLKGCMGRAREAAAGGHQGSDDGDGIAGGGAAGGWGRGAAATVTVAAAAAATTAGTVSSPPRPVLLVGNQCLLGLDSLAVLNEVCLEGAPPMPCFYM